MRLFMTFLACILFSATVMARATDAPRIHPKKIELLHGVVTDTRTVPAYAAALGASTSPVGNQFYIGGNKIKDSTIFRVKTASGYFDLLKWCNGYGTPGSWGHWEQLHIGETIVFRVVKKPVKLSIQECEDSGLLTERQGRQALDFMSLKGQKVYRSHCRYSVMEAYVMVPDKRWTFRIVDSGPRSEAKNRQVGARYSKSLAPLR